MAFDTSGIRLKPCVDLFSTEASRQDALRIQQPERLHQAGQNLLNLI